ncbi:MAG: histidine phosphatase family protein, partial [Fidelibacterota bacterium]
MKLYLVQHGESLSKDVDPERGLTDRGKEEVTRVAAVLVKGNIRVEKILHSGKKRAQETALLLQECLAAGGEFGEMEGLAPLDPVKPVAED